MTLLRCAETYFCSVRDAKVKMLELSTPNSVDGVHVGRTDE